MTDKREFKNNKEMMMARFEEFRAHIKEVVPVNFRHLDIRDKRIPLLFVTILLIYSSFQNMYWIGLEVVPHIVFELIMVVVYVCWMLFIFALTAIFIDVAIFRRPSQELSWYALVTQYFFFLIGKVVGFFAMRRFRLHHAKNVRASQQSILFKLLKLHANTEYGKKYGFGEIRTIEDFRKVHPITQYDHYAPYIQRILDGESDLTILGNPSYFGLTSGTTSGKNKVIPIGHWRIFIPYFGEMSKMMSALVAVIPEAGYLQPHCYIKVPSFQKKSPKGVDMGAASAYSSRWPPHYTAPKCLVTMSLDYGEDVFQYCHLVFGLGSRDTRCLMVLFPATLSKMFSVLENNWQQICDDIENGSINSSVQIDENVRVELKTLLVPKKQRAAELRKQFSAGFDGIVKRCWPHVSYCMCITSGSFAYMANKLQNSYLKGVPMVSLLHGSTEGHYGCNLSPLTNPPRYTAAANYTFCEFIPEEDINSDNPRCLLMSELELGESYELVATTDRSLYRYRTGDIIKVVDYLDQCPVYTFEHRANQGLNLIAEKMQDNVIEQCVMKSIEKTKIGTLRQWTSTESFCWAKVDSSVSEDRRFYVIFIEFENEEIQINEEAMGEFDDTLRELFERYDQLRSSGQVERMLVLSVKSETFLKLRDNILAMRKYTAADQFKWPTAVRLEEDLRVLYDNLV